MISPESEESGAGTTIRADDPTAAAALPSSSDDGGPINGHSSNHTKDVLPKGTVLYWRFPDIGSYWGQVVNWDNQAENYETTWNDNIDEIYVMAWGEVHEMQKLAQHTLRSIPSQFEDGTTVMRYFEDDEEEMEENEGSNKERGRGSWWNGTIIRHDTNHNYTIEWKDGTLEQWDPLSTVAMVQDAEYFLKKKKTVTIKKNGLQKGETITDNGEIPKTSNHSTRSIGSIGSGGTHQSIASSRSIASSKKKKTSQKKSLSKTGAQNRKHKKGSNNILIDPTAYPPTEDGLAEFLNAIDGDTTDTDSTDRSRTKMLNGGEVNGSGRRRSSSSSKQQQPQQAVYHATNVTIGAATTREFTIPIFEVHSTVDWEVTLDGYDVKFAILWQSPYADNDDDRENDIELVEQRTIHASTSRPQPKTSKEADISSDDSTQQPKGRCDASGQFALDESIPIPTTLFLEFDNSYSWFRGKTISYKVTVRSPSSQAMIARATKAVPLVLQALQEAKTGVALQESVVANASQQVTDVLHDNAAYERQVESRQKLVQQAQDAAEEADMQLYKAGQKIQHQHQLLQQQDLFIDEIDKKILDLQHERQVLQNQKATIEVDIISSTEHLKSLNNYAIAQRNEAERIKSDMCDLQIEILTRDQQMAEVEKQHSQAQSNLRRASLRLSYLKRQAEELQKRLNNK